MNTNVYEANSYNHAAEKESDNEEDVSQYSVPPERPGTKLQEIAPKMNQVFPGNYQQKKQFDQSEFVIFERMFKSLKYKFEDVIGILNLYKEVGSLKSSVI